MIVYFIKSPACHPQDRRRASRRTQRRSATLHLNSFPASVAQPTLRAHALRATFGFATDGADFGNCAAASGCTVRAILARACTSLATPVRRALASSQLR